MRAGGRGMVALALGSAISGLLAYVFFAIVTRTLGAVEAAPVSVLWTYWSFSAAAVTFPLQHWIVRSITAAQGRESGVRQAMRTLVPSVVGVALLTAGLAWLVRDQLFHRGDAWFPALVGTVTVGSAFVGVVRGVLTARGRLVATGAALVAENGARCLVALVLSGAGVQTPVAFGLALAGGQLVGLVWPSTLRLAREAESATPWLRFVGGAGGGQLIGQVVLTGGPVALALGGGSPASVTSLFAALALFRAPYTLALGAVSAGTARVTTLVVQGRRRLLRTVRLAVVCVTVVAAAVAAPLGWLAGPWLVRLVFGDQVRVEASVCLLVAVGSAVAVGVLALSVVVMAHDRSSAMARAWVAAALVAAAVLTLAPGSLEVITAVAFLGAQGAAFVLMLVESSRHRVD